LSISFDFN